MTGIVIIGLLSGILLYIIGRAIKKSLTKKLVPKLIAKINDGIVEKRDIALVINHFANEDTNKEEGERYVKIAEEQFPKERTINQEIFTFYINTKNYTKALSKIEEQLEITPEDADANFAKGHCLNKLERFDEAESYRTKAAEIDNAFSDRKFK